MENLKTSELLAHYNEMAASLGLPTVKKFQDRKTAERRYSELLAKFEEAQAKVTKPKRKAVSLNESKTVPGVVTMLKSLKGTRSQAEVFRIILREFPEVTRVQFKHSAIASGYSGLSARNAFDRFRKTK